MEGNDNQIIGIEFLTNISQLIWPVQDVGCKKINLKID